MKDISEFEKLFKVSFPVREHHKYYIDTLMKSPFYASLGVLINEFEQYEIDVEELGYKSSKSYKLDYALPKIKDYIINTSPKRLTKIQHNNIIIIIDKLIEEYKFEENDFVFISHDEFIVRLKPDHVLAINRIHILLSTVGNIIKNEGINMSTHYNVFKLESLEKNKYIKTHYNVKMGGLSENYISLVGIPGNEFFMYFKKYILKEEIDERDLYFIVDKKLAKWVV